MTAVALRRTQRRGTIALATREVRRVLSLWTQTILPPVVSAALFLAVFGARSAIAFARSKASTTRPSSCPACS